MIPVSPNPQRDAYGRLLQLPMSGTVRANDLAPELIGAICTTSQTLFDKLPTRLRKTITHSLFGIGQRLLEEVFDVCEAEGEAAALKHFLDAQEKTRRQMVNMGKVIPRPAEEIVLRQKGIEWRSR